MHNPTALPPGRATHVAIDLSALRHNLRRVHEAAPGSRVLAAIKANGYGHGLVRVARALADADALGVACLKEALELRQAGVTAPLVLLEGFFHASELELIARNDLQVVIHQAEQIAALEQVRLPQPVTVWLKVDSGMHRLGFSPEVVDEAWRRLATCAGAAGPVGAITHLANADERSDQTTLQQIETFHAAVAGKAGARSIANSAGVLGWRESHADWVRPGIMLYGVSPFVGGRREQEDLRPVMTLRSELIAVNRIRAGERIGYGGTWTTSEAMDVGVVAVGYGDGYPRHAPSGTPVLVNGRRVPLVGRVSMDMITVDLREQPDARIGDPVVLWGEGLAVEEIAEHAGTIAYELLCGVAGRVGFIET